MADLGLVLQVEELGEHRLLGEGGDRQRRDELLRRACQHRADADAALAAAADEVEAFVGSDPPADDEEYGFSVHEPSPRTCHRGSISWRSDLVSSPVKLQLTFMLRWKRWINQGVIFPSRRHRATD